MSIGGIWNETNTCSIYTIMELCDILYIDLSWCSLSVSRYNEYGNSRSNEFDEVNLGFSGVVYNIASLHFETHQLAHHYDFTDEQPNSGA